MIFQFNFWPPGRKWRHLQVILSCGGDQYSHLDTLNIKIRPLFQILLTEHDVTRQYQNNFFSFILNTQEALAPLANVSIISGRWIQSFRHLKCQNSYMVFFFPNTIQFLNQTLCYENCLNENFVCLSCCAGSIEPCTINNFYIC